MRGAGSTEKRLLEPPIRGSSLPVRQRRMPIPETGYIHVGSLIVADPGFTLDLNLSHRLDPSYKKGLQKLKESKLLKIFSSSTD